MTWLIILGGLALLTLGAELLVRGAVGLAEAVRMAPLVIGLTVVAYGTSAPELAVSVSGSMHGDGGVALGNIVGSNIFNVLFILGVSALIVPMAASKQLIRLDVPVMIGTSLLAWGFASDGAISRVEGFVLCGLAVAYTAALILLGRRSVAAEAQPAGDEATKRPRPLWWSILLAVVGLAMLVLGARWLVAGAVDIASRLGVSDLLIGLTIVAAGTSLPEVATSLMAAIRGQRDIAIGNVVGSNVFNLLAVLGGSAAVVGGGVPVAEAARWFDLPVMVAVAACCFPIFLTGGRIERWEGALFFGGYVAYLVYLVLHAFDHPGAEGYRFAMVYVVLPLAGLAILCSVIGWLCKPLEKSAQK